MDTVSRVTGGYKGGQTHTGAICWRSPPPLEEMEKVVPDEAEKTVAEEESDTQSQDAGLGDVFK